MSHDQIDPANSDLGSLPIFEDDPKPATGLGPWENFTTRNAHLSAATQAPVVEAAPLLEFSTVVSAPVTPQSTDSSGAVRPGGRGNRAAKSRTPRERYLQLQSEKERRRGLNWDRVDWADVRILQTLVSEKIGKFRSQNPGLAEETYELRGRALITEEVTAQSKAQYAGEVDSLTPTSSHVWNSEYEILLIEAIFLSSFRLGRLQLLLDLEGIEDIYILGHDNVMVRTRDGKLVSKPPVADSDEDLIALLQLIGSGNEDGPRTISTAHPRMNMSLPGGERLAAVIPPIEKRPNIVIRIHNLIDVTMDDLIGTGTTTPAQRDFLNAAVLAGCNIVVSGYPAAGKTTTLRALTNILPPEVPLLTIETERELHLDLMDNRHLIVMPWQAVEGGGETRTDGSRIGDISLDTLVVQALRHSVQRILLGEMRGPEIASVFAASKAGAGSLSTVHAKSAHNAIERMARMFEQSAANVTSSIAYGEVAENIDFIVHLLHRPKPGGGMQRYISEIAEVVAGEKNGVAGWPVINPIFAVTPGSMIARPTEIPTPETLRRLEDFGWDRTRHATAIEGLS